MASVMWGKWGTVVGEVCAFEGDAMLAEVCASKGYVKRCENSEMVKEVCMGYSVKDIF